MFELADGGAIFLDEMGEMPLTTQTKLLRVLETREFLRVGGETPVHVDLRVIAATNQDLHHRVAIGEFRRDLYHRLNVLHIELPPLRDRRSDIPILVDHFIDEVSRTHGLDFVGISDEAMDILEAYDWPGNVRELRNLVESMVVLAPGGEVRAEDIPLEVRNPGSRARNVPMVRSRGLPVPVGSGGPDAVGRTELEFIFRTLVDMRMDMDQLRQEFERYQQEHAGESGELGVSPRSMHPARRPLDLSTLREGLGDEGLKAGEIAIGPLTDSDDEGIEDLTEVEVVSSDQPSSLALPDGAILFRPGMTMEELEKQAVASALAQTGGNRRKAAELLGIGERTLYRKITRFGLED
jgi:DNA-binding NtrC family response regulator